MKGAYVGPRERRRALLALEDGRVFWGWSFGSERDGFGEVHFDISVTDDQQVFTGPFIGNTWSRWPTP